LGIVSVMASMKETEKAEEALPVFDKLWNYDDPAATEKKFREILPMAEKSGDLSYHTQLLTQIARTQGLQRKFEEAHKTLDTVEKMLTEDTKVSKIRYLLERGRTLNSSGEKEKSKPLFLEAWELGLSTKNDYYAVDAAHMMGIVDIPEKQLGWSEKAIDLIEKSEDTRTKGWLGSLYNNTGWTYHDMKKYDRALELFEKGLKWRQERKDETGTRIAKWTIARTYRSLERIDEAIKIQHALEAEIMEKKLDPDGYVFEELGELYLIKAEKEKARGYFTQAYELLSKDQWLVANEKDRLERLKDLGKPE